MAVKRRTLEVCPREHRVSASWMVLARERAWPMLTWPMLTRCALVGLLPFVLFAQTDQAQDAGNTTQQTPAAAPSADLLKAVEEFRRLTVDLAASQDSPEDLRQSAPRTGPEFHGRLSYFFRNNALDAIPHEIVQRGQPQRKLRRNQYAVNVTGPVFIPKIYDGTGRTFFNFAFEGSRQSEGQSDLSTIPTTLERTGSWAHVVDFAGNPLPVFDPKTTFLNPQYDPSRRVDEGNLQYNRLQFPGNVIPLSDLDPVAQQALQFYPEPNSDAGPFFRNNYNVVSQEVNESDGFTLTMDHTFLEKNRVTVTYNRSTGVDGSAPIFFTVANPEDPPTDRDSHDIRVEHIYTASATTINTLSVRAFSGTFDRQVPLAPDGRPFPRYEISGYQGMGTDQPVSQNTSNNFEINDVFAIRLPGHRLSFEGNLSHSQQNTLQPRAPEGRFRFTAGLTSLPGINNTGHGFASFLLGYASYADRGVVTSKNYFRTNSQSFSFNDQWQVTPSLTVTLNANLNVNRPRYEKYDRLSNISFTEINPENGRPGALVIANQNGYSRGFRPVFAKVSPQIGFAWSVLGNNDTVLRMNYGRFYGGGSGGGGHFGTQAFNGTLVWLSPNQQLEPAAILKDGLPANRVFPDTRLDAANGTSPDFLDTTDRQPMRQFFNIEVQSRLKSFLILTVGYGVEYGRNQGVDEDAANPNAIPLSALVFEDRLNDLEFANGLRPFPQYQDFNLNDYPVGKERSYEFNVQLEQRTSGGLAMSIEYSYEKAYDNSSQGVQNLYDLSQEWAASSFNNFHELEFNYIYEIPFGPGKRWLRGSGWLSQLAGGWAISGTGEINGGEPLTIQARFNNTGGVIPDLRADLLPGVDPRVENPGPELWFNPDAFAQPEDFRPGNSPRTFPGLRGPGNWNTDLTALKRFAIPADKTLEFSASLFNALNHANWNDPDTRIGQNVNAGRIVGSRGGRVVQLQLRLSF